MQLKTPPTPLTVGIMYKTGWELCAQRAMFSTKGHPGSWIFQPQIHKSVQISSNLSTHSERRQKGTFQGSAWHLPYPLSETGHQPIRDRGHAARYSHYYELLWIWQQWFWPSPFACPAACQKLPIFATAGTERMCVSPLLQHHIQQLDLKWLSAAPVCWLCFQGWTSRRGMRRGHGRE